MEYLTNALIYLSVGKIYRFIFTAAEEKEDVFSLSEEIYAHRRIFHRASLARNCNVIQQHYEKAINLYLRDGGDAVASI